jgi:hypothetical protein
VILNVLQGALGQQAAHGMSGMEYHRKFLLGGNINGKDYR